MSYTNHDAVRGKNFGTHTVTAAEATAGKAEIEVTLASGDATINGAVVGILRSGILMSSAKITYAENVLTVATNGETFALTAADVINYIVF